MKLNIMKFSLSLLLISSYLSGVTYAEIADYYSEPGINSFRDVDQSGTENEVIDPFGGTLQLQNIDMLIPGNGGLDIVVHRNYFHRGLRDKGNGIGWDVHFGQLSTLRSGGRKCNKTGRPKSDRNPTFQLADGSTQFLVDNTSSGSNLISTGQWIAKCEGSTAAIYSPSGTKYLMGQSYIDLTTDVDIFLATKITDSNGNYLTINYRSSNSRQISSVTSSDGRRVDFYYSTTNSKSRLSSISANGRSVRYNYTQKQTNFGGVTGESHLTKVTRSDNSVYNYTYYPYPYGIDDANAHLLRSVKIPEGLTTSYKYQYITFLPGVASSGRHTVITQKNTSGGGVASGKWVYKYSPSSQSSSRDKTTITTPIGRVEYFHYGFQYAKNQNAGIVWKIGLLYEKRTYSGSSLTQVEKLDWSKKSISTQDLDDAGRSSAKDSSTYMPILGKRTITRDGATYTTTYSNYDKYGNPGYVQEYGSDSRNTTYTYSNNTSKWIIGLTTKESISGVGSIDRTFDSSGNMTSENTFGVKDTYTYYSSGDLSSHTDPNNKRVSYSSYYRGTARSESHPEGFSVSRTVNGTGTVSSETRAGNRKGYSYNSMDRLTGISYPRGSSASIYWSYSSGLKVTYSRGGFQEITYLDARGNKESRFTDGVKTTYSNNAAGQQTFVSLPGKTTGDRYIKDALGRVKKITRSDGKIVTYTYSGNTVSINNERGITTKYTYRAYGDPDERYLTKIYTSSAGITTSISRNTLGKITRITQGSNTRNYYYNSKYYMSSMSDPETGSTTFSHDNSGNMLSKTVGGKRTNYVYDGLNRLKRTSYNGSPTAYFTYYSSGNLRTANKDGINWTYSYDSNDNLTQERLTVDGHTYTVNHTYDSKDGLQRTVYPDGLSVSYSPDNMGRPTKAGSYVTSASYHPSGQLKRMSYANGKSTNITLDSRLRTDHISSSGAMSLYYQYDGNSNITNLRNALDSQYTKSYGYDGIDRLTSEGSKSIAYDSAGNITRKNIGGKSLTYSYSQNKLTSVRDSGVTSHTFKYDGSGNVIENGRDIFNYDGASDLIAVTSQNKNYKYDAHHQRIVEDTGAGKKYTVYLRSGKLLHEETPSKGSKRNYIYLGGLLVAQAGKCGTVDTDSDGIPDCVEITLGLNPVDASDAALDKDNDELTNIEEYNLGTDINNSDSDSDGIPDGVEVTNNLNPLNASDASQDKDGDGVSNLAEYQQGTDISVPDNGTGGGGTGGGSIPRAPTLISPVSSITDTTPEFTWNAISGVTGYDIQIALPLSEYGSPLAPSDANCTSGSGICSFTINSVLNITFDSGFNYTWRVKANNSAGSGVWSSWMSFSIASSGGGGTTTLPDQVVSISPTTTATTLNPVYTWAPVSGADNYTVGVETLTGTDTSVWREETITASQANCSSTVCSLALTVTSENPSLVDGSQYIWWVRASNAVGDGAWSVDREFTVDVSASGGGGTGGGTTLPDQVVSISPTTTATTINPTYAWAPVSGADNYTVGVETLTGSDTSVWREETITASQANCSSTVCNFSLPVTSENPSLVDGSQYVWWVRASNAVGDGAWSVERDFTVDVSASGGGGTGGGTTLPDQVVTISPTITATTINPTYAWAPVSGADNYTVGVETIAGSDTSVWRSEVITVSQANCSSTVCNFSLPITSENPSLVDGSQYIWWVRASNAVGDGAWSVDREFTVDVSASGGGGTGGGTTLPDQVVSISPTTTATTLNPVYTWAPVSGVDNYTVGVETIAGSDTSVWRSEVITVSQANCSSTVCSLALTVTSENPSLVDGSQYIWWVRASNAVGDGAWSVDREFTVDVSASGGGGGGTSGVPDAPILIHPSGNTNYLRPGFAWHPVSEATQYELGIEGTAGSDTGSWYSEVISVSQAGCPNISDTCVYRPTNILVAGSTYAWWIRAKNSTGDGNWSTGLSVEVDANAN